MPVFPLRARSGAALAGAAVVALAAGGCSGGSAPGDDKLKVVATTNVWASVARAVAGPDVEVESIIEDPAADPHSYESSPQDAAKLSDADLVVLNGGGYDEFAEQSLSSSGQAKPTVEAVAGEHEGHAEPPKPDEHGGHEGHEHGGAPEGGEHAGHDHSANEHVWYDLHVVHETADKVAAELGRLRPQQAQQFRDNAARFEQQVDALGGKVDQIAAAQRGKKVIVTEPVAHYLVERAGLTDITPPSFVNAVEAENDPAAAAIAEIQNAVRSGQAAAVLYNPQTESPVTRSVREAAQAQRTPVVQMTETLPQDQDYLPWMDGQITALQQALAAHP